MILTCFPFLSLLFPPPLFCLFSCWINNNIVFYITVVGYFCIIFLLNISMFIVVLVQLCRIKKKKQLGTQRKTSIQDLRSVAGLTFLLGITWGFAFFAWGPINLIFMYLFAIFNTLQGTWQIFFQAYLIYTIGLDMFATLGVLCRREEAGQ